MRRDDSQLAADDIQAWLATQQHKSLLRFITCGAVDDGKSTLIGRMLWESKLLFDDQLAALEVDSKKVGTRGSQIDYALLLDGLAAEREQGITIDVAYRYFSTARRSFIVADTPGHEQYTRNMVTGASTADLAVLLVDARKGLLTQTRRHSHIVAMLGIRQVVLAVNKMDMVGWDAERFAAIESDYGRFAERLGLRDVVAIPLCAVDGDNVVDSSENSPWYLGPTLLGHLETTPVDEQRQARGPLRLPVQWVCRPNADFRGFAGTITSGVLHRGQRVRALPSGRESTVERIVTADGDLDAAQANQAVTVTLADEIDISRGDMLAAADSPAQVADQFEATLVWMSQAPLLRGRSYGILIGTKTAIATVLPLKHRLNVNNFETMPAETLALNDIGVAEIELDRPIAFDPYVEQRDTGGFILVDRLTQATVAAGMLHFALRRSHNVHVQPLGIERVARQRKNGHRSAVVWLTGLSGAGKSTLANHLEMRLHRNGCLTYVLDGDNIRRGLNKDLGFTPADRVENIRRAAEVARLMVDAGLIVITAFISPFREERAMARQLLDVDEFFEVFVDVPLDVAEARDPKGLYAKARRGELANFTGIDSPYEAPPDPELRLDMAALDPDAAADRLLAMLATRGIFAPPPR